MRPRADAASGDLMLGPLSPSQEPALQNLQRGCQGSAKDAVTASESVGDSWCKAFLLFDSPSHVRSTPTTTSGTEETNMRADCVQSAELVHLPSRWTPQTKSDAVATRVTTPRVISMSAEWFIVT